MIMTPEILMSQITSELAPENIRYTKPFSEIQAIRTAAPEASPDESSVMFLRCPSAPQIQTSPEGSPFYYYELLVPDTFFCSFRDSRPLMEIYELLNEAWNNCISWENDLFARILKRQPVSDLCRSFLRVFPRTFALIDSDMAILYATPGYVRYISGREPEPPEEAAADAKASSRNSRSSGDIPWGSLPDSQVQYMMLREDFHLVASKKEPFYYYEDFNDVNCFCRNIFLSTTRCFHSHRLSTFTCIFPINVPGSACSKNSHNSKY